MDRGGWDTEGKDDREWTETGPRCTAESAQRKRVQYETPLEHPLPEEFSTTPLE